MLGLMLLTAINYQSSLIYLLVFILGSVFLISIWLCFFNLQGMSVRVETCQPVVAGSRPKVGFLRSDNGKDRSSIFCCLEVGEDYQAWPDQGDGSKVQLLSEALPRGIYEMPALKIETFFPFGLIRAWTWLWFDEPVVVYPEPIKPPDMPAAANDTDEQGHQFQTNELSELKAFQQGDSVRRIFWKQYARRDELVVRSPELANAKDSILDWEAYASFGTELALSYLCFDVLELHSAGKVFTLRLPGQEPLYGSGEEHRNNCLRVLAGYKGGQR